MSWTTYDSPLGTLTLVGSDDGLRGVFFPDRAPALVPALRDGGAFSHVIAQLDRYFAGDARTIDVPLALHGTALQHAVWDLVSAVPYGQTTTYGRIASQLTGVVPGTSETAPVAARAAAWAFARTPTPIVVPCHRVVGADGAMRGYLGGIPRKEALLRFEASGGDPQALTDPWAPIGDQQRLALR